MLSSVASPLPTALRRLAAALDKRPDEELLAQFTMSRDETAFAAIVRRHGGLVLDVCRSVLRNQADAEDAFQTTFLALAAKAVTVRTPSALAGWLHGTACQVARKAMRARGRRRAHEAGAPIRADILPTDPSWTEIREAIHDEVNRLPERYRSAVILFYLAGRTQDEVGRALGLSKDGAKKRLERGRALLRSALGRRGFGPAVLLAATAVSIVEPSAAPADAVVRLVAARADVSAVPALASSGAWLMSTRSLLAAVLAPIAAAAIGFGMLWGGPTGQPPAETKAKAPAELPRAQPLSDEDKKTVAANALVDRYGDPLPARAVARLGTYRFRSDDWAQHIGVAPGGRQILGVGSHSLILWDAATGKEVRRFEAPAKMTTADGVTSSVRIGPFALSPDGKIIAVGTSGAENQIWPILLFDFASGRKLGEVAGHKSPTHYADQLLAFATSTQLVSAGADQTIRVWDVASKQEIRQLETRGNGHVRNLTTTTDGKFAIAAGGDHESSFWTAWEVATGKVVHREIGLPGTFVTLAVAPDGKSVAASLGVGEVQQEGGFNEVRMYSTRDWKQTQCWKSHAGRYPQRNSVAFSPDGKTIATGGADQKVRQWDIATAKEIGAAIEPHPYANNVVYLNTDTLITFGAQNAVRFWDAATQKPKLEFIGSDTHLTAIAYSPDGKYVATVGGGGDATVRIWDAVTGALVGHLRADMWDVTSVQFGQDSERIASADSHGVARIWDWKAGRELRAFPDHKGWLQCVAFSPNGKLLATGDDAGTVRLWDLEGKLVRRLEGHTAQISSLVFTRDGQSLVSAGWDHSIRQWSLETGKEIVVIKGVQDLTGKKTCNGHTGPVTSLALSPGDQWLYSGSNDHTICVWEMGSGQLAREIKGQERTFNSSVEAIALSPDGRRLAAAVGEEGHESAVQMWDVITGKRLAEFPGHRGRITKLAFSPNGARLASCSSDTTAIVWDVGAPPMSKEPRAVPIAASIWKELNGDAKTSYAAVSLAVQAGDTAITLLKTKLKPAVVVDQEKAANWIGQLDAAAFADRERASRALEGFGPGVEPFLRKAIIETQSTEVRERAERILAKVVAAEQRRNQRAIEILEMVNTAKAKEALKGLAAGAPGASLTQDASRALGRLANR